MSSSSPGPRASAVLLVWLCNVGIGTVIGAAYLRHLPANESVRLWIFAHFGLVSTIVTLTAIGAAICLVLARTIRGERAFLAAQSAVWMFFHIALYTDTCIYKLFHYHFNGSAWNLLTARGSTDSYRLGPSVWIVAFSLAGLLFAGEWALGRFADRRVRHARENGRPVAWKPASVWFLLFAVPIFVEKSIYASAGLTLDREVQQTSGIFPAYPRISVELFLPNEWRSKLPQGAEYTLRDEASMLDYPHARPQFAADGPRPNILLVVIDSWRQDMLAEDVTPGLWKFARETRRFDDHVSGGNATRFGLFSLFYGLHGSYWWPVLAAARPPVLFDELEGLGYDLRVFSSATMDYPEFRQSAFSRMGERVIDEFGTQAPHERDTRLAEKLIAWWNERRDAHDERPFFAFALLDSPHQIYDFPDDATPFEPFAPELDYVEMAGSTDPELVLRVKNRYRNAVHHADHVATTILDALRAGDDWKNTVVIVTGDHGEEFAEHGHWGHTSNFAPEQTRVPFLMRGPGIAAGVEARPTSHLDVAPTLLELLGADPRARELVPRRQPAHAAEQARAHGRGVGGSRRVDRQRDLPSADVARPRVPHRGVRLRLALARRSIRRVPHRSRRALRGQRRVRAFPRAGPDDRPCRALTRGPVRARRRSHCGWSTSRSRA
ncbi:MAG: sulfatase-like hydrolase/transferase [Planctomycetes bacterium]|nr:sulfatase-like hydrolase/transferase [Planctomycetota bacterium]